MTDQARIRLITRGDDLGSFYAANLAILDTFRNGLLRNTSIMVPTPAFEHAVTLVKDETGLCVGLHITLCSEWPDRRWGPISPPEQVSSLLDRDGNFFRSPHELRKSGINVSEIMCEVQAQLDRARASGLDIRYADEHMGVGWIFDAADRERRRLSVTLREWAEREGLIWHSDRQKVLPNIDDEGLSLTERVIRQLDKVTEGTYLVLTHPAYDTPEIRGVICNETLNGINIFPRFADHQLLCDPTLAAYLHERSIEVVRYDQT